MNEACVLCGQAIRDDDDEVGHFWNGVGEFDADDPKTQGLAHGECAQQAGWELA